MEDSRLQNIFNQLQRYKELEIINQTKNNECHNFEDDFKTNKRKIISNLLGKELANNFSDETLFEFVSCYFNSKIINKKSNPFHLPIGSFVNKTLSNPRLITSGISGDIYNVSFENQKNLFIVKKGSRKFKRNTKIEELPEDLLHEYFIGLIAINSLRQYIPNFVYTFAAFRCLNIKKGNFTTCSESNKFNYIVLENIIGETLKDYIINSMENINQLMLIYVQIFLAMDLAHKLYDYTHYDLHSSNIILRRLNTTSWIRYGQTYVKSDYIATIIDYGYNHINVGGKHFGVSSKNYSIYRNISFPLFDIFKLLIYTYYNILNKIYEAGKTGVNLPLFNKFKQMFIFYIELATNSKFVIGETLDASVISTVLNRYGIPKIFVLNAFNINYLHIINYITTNFKEINNSITYTKPPNATIIEPIQGKMKNVANRISIISLNPTI